MNAEKSAWRQQFEDNRESLVVRFGNATFTIEQAGYDFWQDVSDIAENWSWQGYFNNAQTIINENLDSLQTTLDLAGLAPGVGIIPDGINTAISLARGRWGDAALNAAAMIPGVGQGVTVGKMSLAASTSLGLVRRYGDETVSVVRNTSNRTVDNFLEQTNKLASDAPRSAFEIAQEGGKHSGFLKNYLGKSADELRKGASSLRKQIVEHQSKIAHPETYILHFQTLDPRQQHALLKNKWPSDIARQQEQLDILESLLDKLGGT